MNDKLVQQITDQVIKQLTSVKASGTFVADQAANKAGEAAGSAVAKDARKDLDSDKVNIASLTIEVEKAATKAVNKAITPICKKYWKTGSK